MRCELARRQVQHGRRACDNSALSRLRAPPTIPSMQTSDADYIRRRALKALSGNRTPGYHFPGYFLDLQCSRYERAGVALEMDTAAHNANPDGTTNFGAVAFLADMALAASCRVFLDPSRRTATLALHMRFVGGQARGRLRAEASSEGFAEDTALPQAYCAGRVLAGDRELIRMTGTWVSPPAPDGRPLYPLPWEAAYGTPNPPSLTLADLDANERAVMRRVEAALQHARSGEFIQRLWDPVVRHGPKATIGRLPIGLYVGNRVGHVQGGFSLNVAVRTAMAAVPHHPLLTAVSAWYISPGEGKALRARSTVLQKGRNVAVVRTELMATGGRRVLEVISNHAIPKHPR